MSIINSSSLWNCSCVAFTMNWWRRLNIDIVFYSVQLQHTLGVSRFFDHLLMSPFFKPFYHSLQICNGYQSFYSFNSLHCVVRTQSKIRFELSLLSNTLQTKLFESTFNHSNYMSNFTSKFLLNGILLIFEKAFENIKTLKGKLAGYLRKDVSQWNHLLL